MKPYVNRINKATADNINSCEQSKGGLSQPFGNREA